METPLEDTMASATAGTRAGKTRANLIRFGAVFASLALVSVLIMSESRAAFTATTENTGNAFSAATISLSNDAASALFNVSDMVPGDVRYGCITVTYTGTVDPSAVKVYSAAYTDTGGGDLGAYLDLVIKQGVDAGTCDGTLTGGTAIEPASATIKSFATVTDYGGGVGTWDPSATGQTQRYQFIVTLNTSTPNAQQGKGVTGVKFTWETQAGS